MKLKQILIVFTLVMMFPGLQAQMETPDNCTSGILLNTAFPKAAALQAVLDKYTAAGVPGVSMVLKIGLSRKNEKPKKELSGSGALS